MSLVRGARIGPFVVTGGHPGGGYRALHVANHRRVHLELRMPAAPDRPLNRALQLLRAASIVDSLAHPGIAAIVDRGVLADHRLWVASDLAEGVALSEVLARRRLLAEEAVALVRDLAEIARCAHARSIVHAAIRSDLIVMRTGERAFPIQLGGWADLRPVGGAADDRYASDRYAEMAPERGSGAIDGRVDVFAIGVIAHRALAGRFPAPGAPEPLAGVPGFVAELVTRMLAVDPARRPTAAELHAATSSAAADRALSGPRFARPRWTPAPEPDGERIANVIDLAAARRERS